jgi:hypothetical protein
VSKRIVKARQMSSERFVASASVDAESFKRLLYLTGQPSATLDDRFRYGTSGVIPAGRTVGIGLVWTGGPLSRALAWLIRALFWQGKVFDGPSESLVNRILPIGFLAIRADVYEGESAFDGKPCIVIDYSKKSLVAHMIRDEIRQIERGLHLGIVFVFGWRAMKFALVEKIAER